MMTACYSLVPVNCVRMRENKWTKQTEAAQSLQEGNGDAAGQGSSELMGLIGDYDDDAE